MKESHIQNFITIQVRCLPNQTATAEQMEHFRKLAMMIYGEEETEEV
jgi:hypothetical protein